jgi:hypothetical protein
MNILHASCLAASLTLGAPAAALAAASCSNAVISGNYALHGEGWTGTAAPFLPVSVAGIRSFDGAGSFSGSGYETGGGTPQATTTVGTYTVAANCTVTITFTNTPGPINQTQYGIVTNAGNTVYVTRLDTGYTISLEYDRLVAR